MSYFKFKISVNQERIDTWRSAPRRARDIFRRLLQTEFRDELQDAVDALMPDLAPASAVYPFAFGTEKSKWYYLHVIIPEGLVETDGSHYLRSGAIENGFRVLVADYFIGDLVTIKNIQPKAVYVYGPRQVLGFSLSGWGAEMDVARDLLREEAIKLLEVYWRQAVRMALNGES